MAGEWRDCTLGDVLTLQRGFDLPAQDRMSGVYPIIASTGEVGSHSKAMVSAPGVAIGRSGSIGGGQYVLRDFWPLNTTLWVKDFKGNDVRFCYYLLRSIDFGKFNVGGAVPTLNRNHVHPLPVYVPSHIAEQRAIAHILGTLDDKIELNRRRNQTLEAMTRALFKDWFVDFGPVRAKMEGRDPYLPADLWQHFPDRLDDEGKPEGWKVGVVADLASVSSGKRPKVRFSEPSPEASVPLWGGNGPMAFVPEYLINEPILLTGRVGTLGSVFLISTPCWPSDNTLIVRAIWPIAFEYLFFQLRQIDYASLNRGSTQPLLTQTDLKSQRVILPAVEVLEHFSQLAGSAYRRIDEIEEESRTLAQLRDTLLPKLISGELRIADAEMFIERAGT